MIPEQTFLMNLFKEVTKKQDGNQALVTLGCIKQAIAERVSDLHNREKGWIQKSEPTSSPGRDQPLQEMVLPKLKTPFDGEPEKNQTFTTAEVEERRKALEITFGKQPFDRAFRSEPCSNPSCVACHGGAWVGDPPRCIAKEMTTGATGAIGSPKMPEGDTYSKAEINDRMEMLVTFVEMKLICTRGPSCPECKSLSEEFRRRFLS